MNVINDRVCFAHECEHCGSLNEMTASGVSDGASVRCSVCGGPLGTLGELQLERAADIEDQIGHSPHDWVRDSAR